MADDGRTRGKEEEEEEDSIHGGKCKRKCAVNAMRSSSGAEVRCDAMQCNAKMIRLLAALATTASRTLGVEANTIWCGRVLWAVHQSLLDVFRNRLERFDDVDVLLS